MRLPRSPCAILVVTALGAVLRVAWIHSRLLADEVVTQTLAAASWSDFWGYLQLENTPPLFFLMARWWMQLVPLTEAWTHLLPLLIGTIAIPLSFVVARKVLAIVPSLLVAVLVAVSTPFLTESLEFRTYPLTAVLMLTYVLTFLHWVNHPTWRRLWTIALIAVVGLYSHLQFGLVLVAATMTVLTTRTLRTRWRSWLVTTGAAVASVIPWLVFVLADRAATIVGPAWWSGLSPSRISQFANWIGAFFPLWFNRDFNNVLTGLGLAALVVLAVATFVQRSSLRQPPLLIVFSAWLVVTGILAALVANVTVPKYFIVVFPGLYLLVAFAWARLHPRALAHGLLGVFLATLLIVNTTTKHRGDWLPALQYLRPRLTADTLVLAHPNLESIVIRYYLPEATIMPMLPSRYWTADRFRDLLRYNFQRVITPESVNDLATMTEGYDTVWFVSAVVPRPDFFNTHLPLQWFSDHGWDGELISDFQWDGLYLVRFDRPSFIAR
ncbi:MAG: glycosyltransferase family 39 protein [Candidatus Kerfeldbacteria bacterium]|nr:glycosyltransferase family 39 protein [Candidatus Kerfeldbacteria bacterium]